MKRFKFIVELVGEGDDQEAAWADACEAFTLDPGEPDEAVEDEES